MRIHPMNTSTARVFHRLFILAIFLKGIDGVLEIVAGATITILGPTVLHAMVIEFSTRELARDPGDLLANALQRWFANPNHDGQLFAMIYLLVHGAIKVLLAVCLLRGKTWAYPAASVVFGAFLTYMGYRLTIAWSGLLLALFVIDMATLALVLREWRAAEKRTVLRAG